MDPTQPDPLTMENFVTKPDLWMDLTRRWTRPVSNSGYHRRNGSCIKTSVGRNDAETTELDYKNV